MIHLKKVSKTYDEGQTFSVKEVSLTVQDGRTLVLLGSSGCGKTTLLKMINRLIDPSSGQINIDGQDIQTLDPVELRRSIGYTFQEVGLFPHMTVSENIAIALELMGEPLSKRKARANELLEIVNLKPDTYSSRYPDELSGGQQQRVGVARALATKPKYLLMDEPFGALDAINRDSIQSELGELREAFSITIIFVTHDIFEAIRLGDEIAVMNNGHLEQIGSASDLINHPDSIFVKNLFQKPLNQLKRYQEEVK